MKKNAFTLVELLIVISVSAIVGGLLLVIMTNSSGLFLRQSAKIDQGLGVNDALSIFRKDVKQASSISASYTDGQTAYNSGINQLVLIVPSIDSSGNVIEGTYDYYIYFKDGNYLRYKTFPDSQSQRKPLDQVLATSLNDVIFNYSDNRVKMTLILNQTIATSEANLRNE